MEDKKQETEEKSFDIKIIEQVEKELTRISGLPVQPANVDYLYKLIDIHKDLWNEIYWKEKIKMYNERSYGRSYSENYGRRGVRGTGSGRYRTYGHTPEEIMEELCANYYEYIDGKETYGADMGTIKSLEAMLKLVKKFMKHLKNDAQSKEELQLIQETVEELNRI